MPTVTIHGEFNNSENNMVKLDVYRPNPNGYDFDRDHTKTFTDVFHDLVSGATYNIDITGHTTGNFSLTVSGDVVSGVKLNANGKIDTGSSFTVK